MVCQITIAKFKINSIQAFGLNLFFGYITRKVILLIEFAFSGILRIPDATTSSKVYLTYSGKVHVNA